MNYKQRNLLLLSLHIFNRHAKLSLRDAAKISSHLGFKTSHERISQEFQVIDAVGTRNWWRSLMDSNYPKAFKRLEDAKRKASKDDSHRLSHIKQLPVRFSSTLMPRLQPGDPERLERLLAKKIGNARNQQKLPTEMNIADVLVAFAVFRDLVSEGAFPSLSPETLWLKPNGRLPFSLCRLRDRGGYFLDNCAFRPHSENSKYARIHDPRRTKANTDQNLRRIDQSMEKQIQRQLDLRAHVLGK